ncbi:unnamed protein product, partial [Porites evermanni]
MPWSATQQKRLGFEKNLLEKYFRNIVTWIDPTGNTRVEVRVTCTNDKQYTLRVYLPSDYPSSCPEMIVSYPSSCLRRRDGSLMSGMSGADHILGIRDGCTKICHFDSSLWKDDNTLYQIVMKGLIWLEAYEAHLRTGHSLNRYLQEIREKRKDRDGLVVTLNGGVGCVGGGGISGGVGFVGVGGVGCGGVGGVLGCVCVGFGGVLGCVGGVCGGGVGVVESVSVGGCVVGGGGTGVGGGVGCGGVGCGGVNGGGVGGVLGCISGGGGIGISGGVGVGAGVIEGVSVGGIGVVVCVGADGGVGVGGGGGC